MIGKSRRWMFFPAILLLLILAACSPAGEVAPTATPEKPAEDVRSEDEQIVAEQESSQAEVNEDLQSTESEAVEEQALKPLPKQGLTATDPDTVNLASGEPVLVEFFAFW
jgi:hypothetical protein